ncbi:hypothetical protein NDI56_16635 [Haloarcula sp. S1CR25-12]|uniref:Uncharacterized protein n=1 Tax=Haloarcula saliterrae TaxID=2950534 RepID=A0ABU2FFI9_9EURY|nr:hypothetical protein [Haloarcula sp. S1CR25-12]MDS0261028.1 hypothetical protein [Haloarcula sp. S1CR25-12]
MTDGIILVDFFTSELRDDILNEVIRAGDDAGFETPELESIDASDQGKPGVTLSWPFKEVDVAIHYDNDWDELERALTVTLFSGALQSSGLEHPDEFVDSVIDLVCSLAESNDPEYVAAHNAVSTDSDPVIPTTRPILDDIDRLPTLGIYSRDMVDVLGGRDRVLETPAWRVEELDNGQILIITEEPPWYHGGGTANATRFLLSDDE